MIDLNYTLKAGFAGIFLMGLLIVAPISKKSNVLMAQDPPPELIENGEENNSEARSRRGRRSEGGGILNRRRSNREDRVDQPRAENKKRGFLRRLFFRNKAPQQADQWHIDTGLYNNLKKNDYFEYGYAMAGDEWFPIFIHRYFVMIKKQYQHTLVIKGRPESIPKLKGIRMSPYGLEIKNQGFEFELPTFPSVDRQQKSLDEYEFRRVAEVKLEEFGFIKIVWLEDKSKKVEDMAETWRAN